MLNEHEGQPGVVSSDHDLLHLHTQPHPSGPVVIHARGEIDTVSAPFLAAQLTAGIDAAAGVVLDLTEVSFLASAGLTVLLAGRDHAARNRCLLKLVCGDSTAVRRILQVAGLVTVLDIVDL